ncbi:MAG: AAA family ATPase [Candidatus Bathyarchaeia archaeon]
MIEELTLGGFKSYHRRQTVRFTPGVNKISGRNATGKTTLLEAVLFGLFGEVPGVNKRELVPLDGGKLYVSIIFRSPYTDQRVKIVREGEMVVRRRGASREEVFRTSTAYMEVAGEEPAYPGGRDIQRRLRELLGVGKRVFFNIVYAQQKEFVEILKPEQGRMDAILGLTAPAEIREQLKEVARELEARGRIRERGAVEERIRNAEAVIAEGVAELGEVEGRRAELRRRLHTLTEEQEAAKRRMAKIEALEEAYGRLDDARNRLEILRGRQRDRQEDLVRLYEDIGEQPERRLAGLREGLRASMEQVERMQRLLDEDLGERRRELDGEMARLEHLIGEHLELKEQGFAICPKCGQRVDHKLLEEDLRRWTEELEVTRRRLADLERERGTVRSQLRSARARRIEAEREVSTLREKLRRIEELKRTTRSLFEEGKLLARRIEAEEERLLGRTEEELGAAFPTLQAARESVEGLMRGMREELASIQADVRSVEALLAEAERRKAELETRLEAQRGVLEESMGLLHTILEYEAKIAAVERVSERYREYERVLRDSTLRQLEWLTGEYFQRLTDQRVYSACRIDRKTYTLEVQPLGSRRLLPAWRTGGGHESLFALSERLALLRVMGFPHLLILDEPTDAVDSQNIPQLLEYIARSSREIGQVLLVTHHGYGEEEGVNLIRVRKKGDESFVYQEAPPVEAAD